ncbi:MAG: NADH-quinone oxidoreductase subunit NuoB [Paenirhodobacter sp.]|uniref:NADH-quinone oxidoreductase subunit NuoB n=1 Tax=Paenirhodobacter sp. TaxID=1965326 RepID=UPI003D13894C
MDEKFLKNTERTVPLRAELRPRTVTTPDGQEISIDPLKDYFCEAAPKVHPKAYFQIVENFYNWARSNSLWILGFGTGCGAIEMRPLMTPRFDAYRYGVQWRPTPRQANLLMISGYLSVKTLKRAIRAYEQMQGPKYVVGLGSCTINGGMYWDSYNTIKRLDAYLPVDLYIAGCMPRPEALLAGFMELKKVIRAGKAEGANLYAENFATYKAAQKSVIKDWDMPDYNW